MIEDQRGAVTAEAAVVMPLMAAFAVAMVFMVNVGVTHVRGMDAAREAARSIARGTSTSQATSIAKRVAASGARVRVAEGAKIVTVTVTTPVSGPGGLLRGHFGSLTARSVAAMEPEQLPGSESGQ